MNIRTIRTLALGFGLTATFATAGLQAATYYNERVSIPFDFKVGKTSLAAGEYRVSQEPGKDIAFLTNVKTSQRVQTLRTITSTAVGHATLTFENKDGVRVLKQLR